MQICARDVPVSSQSLLTAHTAARRPAAGT